MPLRCALTATILAALSFNATLGQTPLGPGFTYQGRLRQNGQPYNGSATMVFKLYDSATGGTLLGTQTLNNVNVSAGLFTAVLNGNGEFGGSAFNGQSRWLEVTANGTLLSPRQALNATPYAAFAGAPWQTSGSNVFYTGGNVGIGTASPGLRLTVAGDAEIGTSSGDYHYLRVGGGNSSGFLYGSYPHYGDGIHLGYNYYADATGAPIVPNAGGGTSRISTGYGFVSLATGDVNTEPVDRLVVAANGNVGIGTFAPDANLEIFGSGADAIHFGVSGHTRVGILYFDDHFYMRNGNSGINWAQLQDDCTWTVFSDRRVKTDITPAEGLLAKALALRPAKFYMKDQDLTRDPQRHLGLIAQDVQPVLPELVYGTDMLSLDYGRIGVVAIGAIQEQQALIADQKRMIDAQQERITTLEDQAAAVKTALASLRNEASMKDARVNDLTNRLEKLESLASRLTNEPPRPGPGAAQSVPPHAE